MWHRATQMRAMKGSLDQFVKEMQYRENMKCLHINVMQRVVFIQRRFKVQAEANAARMQALQLFWGRVEDEIHRLARKRGAS